MKLTECFFFFFPPFLSGRRAPCILTAQRQVRLGGSLSPLPMRMSLVWKVLIFFFPLRAPDSFQLEAQAVCMQPFGCGKPRGPTPSVARMFVN